MQKKIDCVIMAAGMGKRLMPLTKNKPKCMVKVNRKPIIRHLYDNIRLIKDIKNIIIISGYKEKILFKYAKENFERCIFVNQEKQNGTANAVFLANGWIRDNFIVLSGDVIYSKQEIEHLMRIKNSLLYTRMNERLYEYGTLNISGQYIKHIDEKQSEPISRLVNCGAYHFTKDVFKFIEETDIDIRFNERIITNTINLMIDSGIKFKGIPIKYLNEISYPEDIGKVEGRL